MSNIIVYKASAGSGKTHRITQDYLKLAFASNFQNILAVTFTNKATAEMKGRILEELYKLSKGDKSDFIDLAGGTTERAKIVSSILLENILHNYSRFSVSTIDSFLSRIFRSFLHESGVNSIYDIELNKNHVLEKVTEMLFENVENNPDLKNWLTSFAFENINRGKSWEIQEDLMKLGAEILNESFKLMDENTRNKYSNKEYLNKIRELIIALESDYENKITNYGKLAMDSINSAGLISSDFKQGTRGVYNLFNQWSEGVMAEPNSYAINCLNDPNEWCSKSKNKIDVEALRDKLLMQILSKTISFININRRIYKSCKLVLNQYYAIGILGDLSKNLLQHTRKENKILLSEAGALLCNIVGENDASFVFEKAGNLYKNFMFDEFQDTSLIQWKTLMPLVKNGLSENGNCMIVGDVKQSIYRWRNGDWELLAGRALVDLNPFQNTVEDLKTNWRSAPEIVKFNNNVFIEAPQILQNQFNSGFAEQEKENQLFFTDSISSLYKGEPQLISNKTFDSDGFVKLYFLKKGNKNEASLTIPTEVIHEKLPGIIIQLLDKGFQLKDIAILVRKKSEGDKITKALSEASGKSIDGKTYNFSFISDENLYLDESPAVNILLAAIRYISNQSDLINLTSLIHSWNHEKRPDNFPNEFIFRSIRANGQDFHQFLPGQFIKELELLAQLPLISLAEEIIKIFELGNDEIAAPYLMAFMDQVVHFNSTERGSPARFIEWWDKNKDSFSLSVNDNQNAIRVLTFHKSKGLEFKIVIIPFCDWTLNHDSRQNNIIWCNTTVAPFNMLDKIPVRYSDKMAETLFAADYFQEKQKAYIDNLNLLYVGLTRAKLGLIVFAPFEDNEKELKTSGDLLEIVCRNLLKNCSTGDIHGTSKDFDYEGWQFESGTITTVTNSNKPPAENNQSVSLDKYPIYPFINRLTIKYQGEGFFETDRTVKDTLAVRGKVMHELFSLIKTRHDIEKAIDLLISKGKIELAERTNIINRVNEIVDLPEVKQWFAGECKILTEAEILIPGKGIKRPDRVMIANNTVIVVDYKFGEFKDKKHEIQVREYCKLMQEMGYEIVQGYILYFELKKVSKVVK